MRSSQAEDPNQDTEGLCTLDFLPPFPQTFALVHLLQERNSREFNTALILK
jgi:hypothetical protein